MKRIFAILGIVLLLSMYVATFVFALMKSPASTGMFKAAVYCTITVPVLLYGYSLVYKYLKNRNHRHDRDTLMTPDNNADTNTEHDKDEQ